MQCSSNPNVFLSHATLVVIILIGVKIVGSEYFRPL